MNNRLQHRARKFTERPVPAGLDFVPGSIAENCIAQYAKSGQVDLSSEFAGILKLFLLETKFSADHKTGEEGVYFRERYEILKEILAEFELDNGNA